jgi:hypothetical protein
MMNRHARSFRAGRARPQTLNPTASSSSPAATAVVVVVERLSAD